MHHHHHQIISMAQNAAFPFDNNCDWLISDLLFSLYLLPEINDLSGNNWWLLFYLVDDFMDLLILHIKSIHLLRRPNPWQYITHRPIRSALITRILPTLLVQRVALIRFEMHSQWTAISIQLHCTYRISANSSVEANLWSRTERLLSLAECHKPRRRRRIEVQFLTGLQRHLEGCAIVHWSMRDRIRAQLGHIYISALWSLPPFVQPSINRSWWGFG